VTALDIELGLLVIASTGMIFALAMTLDGLKDLVFVGGGAVRNGQLTLLARSRVRTGALILIAQFNAFYTATSFLGSPVPLNPPLDRLVAVTVGSAALLLLALDQYLTTRRLMGRAT
jgi:hypothetical protein